MLFLLTILLGVYPAVRKFKQVNTRSDYFLWQTFFCLSFAFTSYIYNYVIVEYFKATKNKIKKAMIAALTPGIVLLPTAIGKYLVKRSSELIPAHEAYLICYFLLGGAIMQYRTMQLDFQNIWLFISLSLLHGVSNALTKAMLNLRIKMRTYFVRCANKTQCGASLEVLPSDTP